MRTRQQLWRPWWPHPLHQYLLPGSQLLPIIRTSGSIVRMMIPYNLKRLPLPANQLMFMLMLLLVPVLSMMTSETVYAATNYTIGSDAQCTAFLTAIGAVGEPRSHCYVYRGTLPAGDTLTLTNNWMLRPQSTGIYPNPPHFVNYGTITGGLYTAGTFENRGMYTVRSGYFGGVIENYGTMIIDGRIGGFTATINNYGTIRITCNGVLSGTGVVTGNAIQKQACNYTIGSDAQCTAFLTAIGAIGEPRSQCYVNRGTLPAGDTLTLTNNWMLRPQSTGFYPNPPHFVNYGTITGGLYNAGTFENRGMYTVRSGYFGGVIENYGTMIIDGRISGFTATINNYGTIRLTCNSVLTGTGVITGKAPINFCDSVAPTANPTHSPPPAPSGWNNTNVTVSWNWSDNSGGSGIDPANCTTSSVSSGSATITLTATCKDLVGNQGSATYQVRVDPTAPIAKPNQSPAANAAGWNKSDVSVNWNWGFTGASIDTANCTNRSTSSGEGTLTLSATCKDVALNQGTATYVVKVDKSAPLISGSRTPLANSAGWNNSAVTVAFTCQEQGTGSGLSTNTVGGATLSTQGANQVATNTGTCVDIAGNVAAPATVSAINIDLTKPTISADLTSVPNANGWFNRNVTIAFLCNDLLSGIATCALNEILSSEGTAVASTAQTSSDKAGNVSNPSNIVTVKIDKTAPSVMVTGVSDGATYAVGSVPTAACSTSDALSGVVTQAIVAVTGGNGDGSGNFTATCSGATDNAGNSATAVSVTYTVLPPTSTPTVTATPSATSTATATSTPTPTPTATATASATSTATATSTPTPTPTATATASATSMATATSTPTPTATVTSTPTPGATSTPILTPPPVTPGAASITIVLDVQPNAITNYSFSSSFGPFRLDDAGADDGDNYTNSLSFLVTAGSYSVIRTATTGRVTAAIDCTLPNRAAVDLDANRVTLTVSGGDNITCTFVVGRSSTINARVFEDLVRNGTNLGKRNAGDPWFQGWSIKLFDSSAALVATQMTAATATAGLYEASFANLRPGAYVICSAIPDGAWIFATPNTLDPRYGLPCKSMNLDLGQSALLLFGAYQATTPAMVVAADSAEAVVTDEEQIIDVPYEPAEEANVVEEANPEAASRFYLPLVSR